MNKENLFDLVAPIYIYHFADVMYEKKAKKAFREIMKKKDATVIQECFGDLVESLDIADFSEENSEIFYKIYTSLFESLVQEAMPTFKPFYDLYGAKCFRDDTTGRHYLNGDAYNQYPYYLEAEALYERLADLQLEIA